MYTRLTIYSLSYENHSYSTHRHPLYLTSLVEVAAYPLCYREATEDGLLRYDEEW